MRNKIILTLVLFTIVLSIIKYKNIKKIIFDIFFKETLSNVLDRLEFKVKNKYQKKFLEAGISFPPKKIILSAYKKEKVLELWAKDDGIYKLIYQYEIKKASGRSGPKMREGDLQVPEGIYSIVYLNPASQFYLSFKLDYPNAFDRQKAQQEDRKSPGNDIFIHGKEASVGCLAMGDDAIEDLFWLVGRTGIENVTVIISPNRTLSKEVSVEYPSWIDELYGKIRVIIKENLNL